MLSPIIGISSIAVIVLSLFRDDDSEFWLLFLAAVALLTFGVSDAT